LYYTQHSLQTRAKLKRDPAYVERLLQLAPIGCNFAFRSVLASIERYWDTHKKTNGTISMRQYIKARTLCETGKLMLVVHRRCT